MDETTSIEEHRARMGAALTPSQIVGYRVTRARQHLGLNQEELGRQLAPFLGREWSKQTVSTAEKGRRQFDVAELLALAAVLKTSVLRLLEPTTPEQSVRLPGKELAGSEVWRLIPGDVSGAEVMAGELRMILGSLDLGVDKLREWIKRLDNEEKE